MLNSVTFGQGVIFPNEAESQQMVLLNCRAQCYKTFYGRNLRMFVISQSVCPLQESQPILILASKARGLP